MEFKVGDLIVSSFDNTFKRIYKVLKIQGNYMEIQTVKYKEKDLINGDLFKHQYVAFFKIYKKHTKNHLPKWW
jgi:hypothetical protein